MVFEFFEGGKVMFEIEQVSGIGEYVVEERPAEKGAEEGAKEWLYRVPEGKVFLVVRPKTLELRSDGKLAKMLQEKYESVMESRYFGRGGVEIVPSGQLAATEIEDLVRLSYNLSREG